MRVLLLPKEYPTTDNPLAGIFIKEQYFFLKKKINFFIIYNYFRSLKKIRFISIFSYFKRYKKKKILINFLVNPYFNFIKLYLDFYLTKKIITNLIIKKEKPDLIHCHFSYPTGITAYKIYRELKIPYVITEHSTAYFLDLYSSEQISKIKLVLDNAKKIIVVSNFLKNYLLKITTNKNIHVIGNVIDTNVFNLKKKTVNKTVNFTIICELVEKKRVDELLKIIRDLKRLNLKFYLNIVGIGYQYKLLKKYVHKNNLEGIVKFLGYQNKLNIKKILNRSDYLISCSYVETFGITIAESIASGVPVLCINSGGPKDFVKSFNGFLLKDFNELKFRMITCINNKHKFDRKKMFSFIKKNYSQKVICKKIIDIYKDIK